MPSGRFMNYEWYDILNGLNLLLKRHKIIRTRLLTKILSVYNPHNESPKDLFSGKINGMIHELEKERSDKIRNKSASDYELQFLLKTKEAIEELAKKVETVDGAINRLEQEIKRVTQLSAMHNTIFDHPVETETRDTSDDGEEETDWLTEVILSPEWGN